MDIGIHALLMGCDPVPSKGGMVGAEVDGVIVVVSTTKDTMRVVAHAMRAAKFCPGDGCELVVRKRNFVDAASDNPVKKY